MKIPLPPRIGKPGTNRLITRLATTLEPAVMCSPLAPVPAAAPFSSMSGLPAKPGCVVPSIVTGSVIAGRAEARAIVFEPDPIENRIVSAPGEALAALIASRSVQLAALQIPSSVSAAEFTVKVAAEVHAAGTRRSAPRTKGRPMGRPV